MARGKDWTTHEIAVLKEIHGSGLVVKQQVERLPGRSLYAIRQAIGDQGWERKKRGKINSWVWPSIEEILEHKRGLSAKEIAILAKCCYGTSIRLLRGNHVEKNVHICGWKAAGAQWVEAWALGEGQDVPKPHKFTHQQAVERARIVKRRNRGAFNPFEVTMRQILQAAA